MALVLIGGFIWGLVFGLEDIELFAKTDGDLEFGNKGVSWVAFAFLGECILGLISGLGDLDLSLKRGGDLVSLLTSSFNVGFSGLVVGGGELCRREPAGDRRDADTCGL